MDSAYTQGKSLIGLSSFPGTQLGGEINGFFLRSEWLVSAQELSEKQLAVIAQRGKLEGLRWSVDDSHAWNNSGLMQLSILNFDQEYRNRDDGDVT